MVVNNAGYAPATNNPSDNTIANNIFVSDHDKCIQYDFSDNEINTNIFHSIDSQEVLRSNYILADPNFVGQGINSRLSSISPAIDKAIPIFGFEINIDLDGNARPQGIRNDIGAHEFLQSFQPPQSVEIIK